MRLIIPAEVSDALYRITLEGSERAQNEVAQVCSGLRLIRDDAWTMPDYWNVRVSALGLLSYTTRANGSPIWRLCPAHVSCIALLTTQDDDLLVLGIYSRAEVEKTEQRLVHC